MDEDGKDNGDDDAEINEHQAFTKWTWQKSSLLNHLMQDESTETHATEINKDKYHPNRCKHAFGLLDLIQLKMSY